MVKSLSANSYLIYILHAPLVPVFFALAGSDASRCAPWALILIGLVVFLFAWFGSCVIRLLPIACKVLGLELIRLR